MIKTCQADSWPLADAAVELVKYSSRGLVGQDAQRLAKRAGDEFVHKAAQVEFEPGEVPGHMIAMAATEFNGANRNGDGFKAAMLRRTHDTFQSHARAYRNHKNKNPKKSYGRIKLSWYNEPMGRVELLVGYNGDEKTAERNDGLVADEECNTLLGGSDFPVSMAISVPYDVCSACQHKSATRKDYCKSADEGGTCTLFGCTSGLTKVSDDGHIQHVDNPEGVFFDISKVGRPADRVAYAHMADYLTKSAEAGRVVSGAEWAELYRILPPVEVAASKLDWRTAAQLKLAYQFSQLEDELFQHGFTTVERMAATALPAAALPLEQFAGSKVASVLSALSSQGILVSLPDFARLTRSEKYAAEAQPLLADIYTRLIEEGNLPKRLRTAEYHKLASSERDRLAAYRLAAEHSLAPQHVQRRLFSAAIKQAEIPQLLDPQAPAPRSVSPEAAELATEYAIYKLAHFAEFSASAQLTTTVAVHQNYLL